MIALPSYIDIMLWSAFIEMRKEIKHPLTQSGQKLAVMELMKLHNDGWDCNASLRDSTIKSYRGLFPVARIAVEATEKPKAVQVSDEHKLKCTPMPESLKKLVSRK